MFVMMMAATNPDKTPAIELEQCNDLADFHSAKMEQRVGRSGTDSLRSEA
jgi:hypothetical protein